MASCIMGSTCIVVLVFVYRTYIFHFLTLRFRFLHVNRVPVNAVEQAYDQVDLFNVVTKSTRLYECKSYRNEW